MLGIIGERMSSRTSAPLRHLAARSDGIPEGGRLFAYENTCPHMGGPVCQGLIIPAVRELVNERQVSTGYAFDESEMRIVCPWHGYEFSIETGSHPAKASIRLTPVAVEEEGGDVYVTL